MCCICEFGVYSELYLYIIIVEEMKVLNLMGIIFLGGFNSVYDEDVFCVDERIFDMGILILGICYGM